MVVVDCHGLSLTATAKTLVSRGTENPLYGFRQDRLIDCGRRLYFSPFLAATVCFRFSSYPQSPVGDWNPLLEWR